MKKITLAFILIFQILFVSAQNNWVEMMEDPTTNFYDVQAAFENYFQNHTIEKGKGWKQFKRWEYFMAPRVFPTGERFSPSKHYEESKNYLDVLPQNRTLIGQWRYIGNQVVPADGGGAGRINCIAFKSGDPNTIYVGTPAGSLWISRNGGNSWRVSNDNLPTMGISTIVTHPTDTNIIYIGTGDADGGDTYCLGIMKSVDGGQTFQPTGLTFGNGNTSKMRKLLIHPTNPDILIAATSNGIYKTTDGGITWNITFAGNFYDLEFKPNDPSIVYTCAIGKLYQSLDTANTFTQLTNGLPGNGSGAGRICIGVSPANSNYIYLLIGGSDNGFHSFYRSTDNGASFTLRTDSPNLLGWDTNGGDSGGQAWYDMALVVSRTNIDQVWTGGVNVWKSTNGGSSFVLDAHWYGGGGQPYVHADIHAMEVIPGTTNTFLIGCDGGLFKTTNAGTSYSDLSNNLQIAQIYKMGISTSNSDLIISGWQDNGTNLKTSTSFDKVMGGDGMDCMIAHNNNQVMYGEVYYGSIEKSTNGGNSFNNIVSSGGTAGTVDEDGDWVTPMIMHPTNSNTILVGKSQVYRSTNAGNSFSTVGTISGGSGKIIAMAYAPSDPNYIYALKSNKVFVSTDGNTFVDRTTGLPTGPALTNVAVDADNPQKVWVTFSGFSSNYKIYHSNDAGLTWTNYNQGLPNLPVNCIVYQNGSNDGLYIGTDMGVFYRDSSLSTWQYFSNGLPNTVVNDLEIYYATGKLRAATYGRGIWETDLFTNIFDDASITTVASPNGNVCNTTFAPTITLTNSGDNDLTSAEIYYAVDGAIPSLFNWNGLLHEGESILINLPAITTTVGAHTFEVLTLSPNGNLDSNSSNDTLQTSFNVITTGNEVTFTLALDCFGEEISWNIKDGSNNTVYQINMGTYLGDISIPEVTPLTITTNICLDAGCYTFTINDSGGNGLAGDFPSCNTVGTYYMVDEIGTSLFLNPFANGNFGATEVHNFCVSDIYNSDFSSSPNQICSGNAVQFYDLSSPGTNSWNWTFPGGNPSSSTLQNPIVVYNTAGTFDVSLLAGDGTNSNTQTVIGQISVFDSPQNAIVFDSIICFGECTAMIDLTVNGGTVPFNYTWNDGASSEDRNNLCEGTYQVILRDENGCRDTSEIIIYSPTLISFGSLVTQATCGVNDGTITSNVMGGNTPYDYLWSTNETTTSISGLGIGSYSLTIIDANGCELTENYAVLNPNAPVVNATSIPETCLGNCDGAIQSFASGGTGTLVYLWDNGLGSADTITNLCGGTFIISVTDDDGCEGRDTVVINPGTPYPNVNFTTANDTVQVGTTVNFVNLTSGANQHLWDFGDGNSSTFSSAPNIYDTVGLYTVILYSCQNGCCSSDTMMIYVGDFTSINEFNKNDFVNIYPNPTSDILTIDFKVDVNESAFKIFDNTGRLILSKNENQKQYTIDLSKFSNGIYLIEIEYNDTVLPFKAVKR